MTQAPAPARPRRRAIVTRLFPGERRIWLAAAATLGIGAIAVLVSLLLPRDYYTGTNSVRTRAYPVEAARGDKVCIPNLNVPAGTGRVQIGYDTAGGPRPGMTGTLTVAGRDLPPSRVPPSGDDRAKLSFQVPERPDSPASAPATFCIDTEGKIFFGGVGGLQGNDIPPTVNGQAQGGRLAVWFLPPRGEQRSLLSHPQEILERAALFRPSFVSPAFYWVLLLVFMPLVTYAAVRLLAGAATRTTRRQAIAVLLIAFANASAWAFVSPSFNAPDESEHFAYLQYFAETGHAIGRETSPGAGVYATEEGLGLDAVRLLSTTESSDGRPPWLALNERNWRLDNAKIDGGPPRDNGGAPAPAIEPHSPAYYALLTPAYEAAGGGSVWDRLAFARLTSALLGAIAAMCAFLLVREFLPRQPLLATAGGLLVGLHPMFAFMSGAVNNDTGVNAAAAVVILLTVRAMRRGMTWRTAIGLGAAVAIMPVLKGTGFALYPLLLLAGVGLLIVRHGRRDLIAYAVAGAAFLVTFFVWTRISAGFGTSAAPTPGGTAPASLARENPAGYISFLWQVFLPPLPFMTDLFVQRWPFFNIYIERGWGSFGWYSVQFPRIVYGLIVVATAAVGAAGVLAVRRNLDWAKRNWLPLAFVALVPAVVIAAVEAAYFSPTPRDGLPEFGRYLFPAITPLAAMAVGGCLAFGRRNAGVAATVLVCAVAVLNYASQLLTLAGFYT